MPIDPKKFKKIVTNHFNNLTEEEFLKTLHKSSPDLFNNILEREDVSAYMINNDVKNKTDHNISLTSEAYMIRSDLKDNVKHKMPLITWKILRRFLKVKEFLLSATVFLLFLGSSLNHSFHNNFSTSIASPVFTSRSKFQCEVNGNSVVLFVKISGKTRPFIKFTNDTNADNSMMNRCEKISKNFTRYTAQSDLYITTDIRNGRSILCASNKNGECIKDDYGGELLSLGTSDIDPKKYLKLLLGIDSSVNSFPIFRQAQDRIYIE